MSLTRHEFRLLQSLLEQPERVFSREQLLDAVGVPADAGYERNIDSHIKSLRSKLRRGGVRRADPDPSRPGLQLQPEQQLMRLARIFLVYALSIGLTGYFVLSTVMKEIRPGVRQSTEETLVDTANLWPRSCAMTSKPHPRPKPLAECSAYGNASRARPSGPAEKPGQPPHLCHRRQRHRVARLHGEAVGQDYSEWNDVYLTLRGEYGARSTRSDPDDATSSVMHVGAPIRDNGQIIGVVTVAKPNSSLQPYVDRTERRRCGTAPDWSVLGLLFGALLSWWLSVALRRLTAYAEAVSEGRRAELPHYRGGELKQLATAVEHMRTQLEGKAYVERYVHTLTHELKSPLAAIRGAAELLQGEMTPRAAAAFCRQYRQRKRAPAAVDRTPAEPGAGGATPGPGRAG